MTKNTHIPAIAVVEWSDRVLFGKHKVTWVLPSVKVTVVTRARQRLQSRKYGIGPNGASENVTG